MHVDDLAEAAIHFMKKKHLENYINVGTGKQSSIIDYAKKICEYLKVKPIFEFDLTKPVGMKTKVLDVSLARKLGWRSKITLRSGIGKLIVILSRTIDEIFDYNCSSKRL